MSEPESRQDIADDRQPLAPGTRIGNAYLVLTTKTAGSMAFSYEGLRLADQTNVTLYECFPRGLAARGQDGRVAPIRGWEDDFAAVVARFDNRMAQLRAVPALGLILPLQDIEDRGTLYAIAAAPGTPSLSAWAGDLMRRPGDADLARLSLRLATGLQAMHQAGLGHGAVGDEHIHLDEPGNAVLTGLMLEDFDTPRSAGADIRALAAALYSVVTGRMPPPEARDRSLDARFAARHIAAGDYSDSLLDTLDAALGLGEAAQPEIEPAAWLARLIEVARAILGEPAAAASTPKPKAAPAAPVAPSPATADRAEAATGASGESAKPAPQQSRPRVEPKPREAVPAQAARRASPMRYAALAGLLLAGIAGWLGYLLLRGAPNAPASPQVASPATPPPASAAKPAEPPKEETQRRAEPATPEPARAEPARPEPPAGTVPPRTETAVATPPPAPPPPPAITAADLAAAGTREAVLALLAKGAPADLVARRMADLGYIAVTAAGETLFRKPGDGETFRDCTICPELVLAPPGKTQMQVTIADSTRQLEFTFATPFAVARFEVTRGQFAAFIRETGRPMTGGCHARRPQWGINPALSWEQPGFAQGDDHPVACVSFLDASAYAEWLSARTGQRYRLPSDAEWHYLAAAEGWRTGEAEQLCRIGNGADLSAKEANPDWQASACRDGFAETAPVGRHAAGPWGLHDLNGNVWEWVGTCAPEPVADAEFPPKSCAPGAPRLLRGGSWADAPTLRQLDSRVISAPNVRDQVAGFRLIREP